MTTITTRDLNKAKEVIRDIYNESRATSNNPELTVRAIIGTIGIDLTAATLATFVNSRTWDGRIRQSNKDYCATVPGALSEDEARNHYLGLPGDIHPSHLDQLVSYLRKIAQAA